jgi:glycerol-3-phosphate dehydrogenase
MPICEQMHQVLFSGADPLAALNILMTRSLKEEGN